MATAKNITSELAEGLTCCGANFAQRARSWDYMELHGTHYVIRLQHLLDAMGAPLGTVQALLGHSTSEITREVYLHAIPEDQRRAVLALNHLFLGSIGLKRTQLRVPLKIVLL